jgi:hypothetical protein
MRQIYHLFAGNKLAWKEILVGRYAFFIFRIPATVLQKGLPMVF